MENEDSSKSNGPTPLEGEPRSVAEGPVLDASSEKAAALEQEIEKLKKDRAYLMADFDNFRKHAIRERSDLQKYSGERLAVELLNVIDNFERALAVEVTVENVASFRQGIQLIMAELKSTFEKFEIREVESVGLAFDPRVHEAVASEETSNVPAGHVARVFRKAYKYHDKILRPAQVVVAKDLDLDDKA